MSGPRTAAQRTVAYVALWQKSLETTASEKHTELTYSRNTPTHFSPFEIHGFVPQARARTKYSMSPFTFD